MLDCGENGEKEKNGLGPSFGPTRSPQGSGVKSTEARLAGGGDPGLRQSPKSDSVMGRGDRQDSLSKWKRKISI